MSYACLSCLSRRSFRAQRAAGDSGEIRWQDYNGRRIGVLTGTPIEGVAAEFFPDSECYYFSSYPDCDSALLAGKIDAYLGDEPGVMSVHAEMPEIDYIHENLTENNYAFAFRKDDPESAALCAELNEFLAKCWADGTMEELGETWLGVDDSRKVVDMSGLTGENGTVRVVTTPTDMPWSYIKDGKNVGYDIDLVVRFCRERGYALELGDVSVTINDGDVIAVIGPSGTGKSTLLRCINLLEKPTGGQIFLNGEEITARGYDARKARRKMGMVFQSFNLFGHLTVIENLMTPPMDLLGKSRQKAYDTAVGLLRRVGLADKALNYPDELSGGQQQRVAIARTLAMDPEIILLDEPTSALDPTMVSEVQAVIRDLSRTGKTMMIVTHEMNFARSISNRVFYMDEGGIYEDGTPEEIFEHPKKERTRRFIRRLKVLELAIDSRDFDFIGAGAEIDRYCLQNDIAAKEKYRIRLAVEELVQQILLPRLPLPDIRVAIEHEAQSESTGITVAYAGERFDPADTDNELSYALLRSTAEELTYAYDAGKDRPNRVEIKVKGRT